MKCKELRKVAFLFSLLLIIIPISSTLVPVVLGDGYRRSYDTIENIGGHDWYYWNANSDSAAVVLFGGWTYTGSNKVWIHTLYSQVEYSDPKVDFIEELHANGYDVLTNKDHGLEYSGSENWLYDVANWLSGYGYNCIYLFGFSGGGVVVAYEIQRPHACIYSVAVVASAPVDWDDPPHYGIFQSAHTASEAKVCTSFIAPVEDDLTYSQMSTYYGNMIVHKEWHNWVGKHDPFNNTCADHSGETVSEATVNWYQKQFPPYTPLKPSGPGVGYRDRTYTYTTSTTDPNGDSVRYQFDWNDGTKTWTEWKTSGATASASHSWSYIGTWHVRVRAQDSNGAYSGWSPIKTVNIVGWPSCPTLFVWNGSEYVEEATLDIHASSDVTVQHRIEETLVSDGYFYKLSLRELDEFTSHIDYVKLYAVDADGERHECYLIRAIHSEIGRVTRQLRSDDNRRVDLAPQQTINLKFFLPQIDEIAYFIFEINGYNPKPR